MKRAIISGATGAIGNALIHELISRNYEVLVLVREHSKRNKSIPIHPLVNKKICDLCQLKNLQNDTGKEYDVFFHMAWAGTFGAERDNMYLQNENVRYTLDAVGVAKRFGCKVFIGAGSQAECGRVEGKLSPETPAYPENGYGMAKLCAGYMSRRECQKYGIKHIWTRILSVYGPGDSENTMISTLISKLLCGEKPALTLCEQQWDYLYSGDVAKAFCLLAEKGEGNKVYCIGSGKAEQLKYYVMTIRNKINDNAELGIGDIPYGEKQVMYLCADISELTKDTGFVPEISFEEGIDKTIHWIKSKRQ